MICTAESVVLTPWPPGPEARHTEMSRSSARISMSTSSASGKTATVTADKGDAGIKVVSSHLAATVEGLEGIDASTLSELAEGAEKGCPISNAIRGNVAITVEAHTA